MKARVQTPVKIVFVYFINAAVSGAIPAEPGTNPGLSLNSTDHATANLVINVCSYNNNTNNKTEEGIAKIHIVDIPRNATLDDLLATIPIDVGQTLKISDGSSNRIIFTVDENGTLSRLENITNNSTGDIDNETKTLQFFRFDVGADNSSIDIYVDFPLKGNYKDELTLNETKILYLTCETDDYEFLGELVLMINFPENETSEMTAGDFMNIHTDMLMFDKDPPTYKYQVSELLEVGSSVNSKPISLYVDRKIMETNESYIDIEMWGDTNDQIFALDVFQSNTNMYDIFIVTQKKLKCSHIRQEYTLFLTAKHNVNDSSMKNATVKIYVNEDMSENSITFQHLIYNTSLIIDKTGTEPIVRQGGNNSDDFSAMILPDGLFLTSPLLLTILPQPIHAFEQNSCANTSIHYQLIQYRGLFCNDCFILDDETGNITLVKLTDELLQRKRDITLLIKASSRDQVLKGALAVVIVEINILEAPLPPQPIFIQKVNVKPELAINETLYQVETVGNNAFFGITDGDTDLFYIDESSGKISLTAQNLTAGLNYSSVTVQGTLKNNSQIKNAIQVAFYFQNDKKNVLDIPVYIFPKQRYIVEVDEYHDYSLALFVLPLNEDATIIITENPGNIFYLKNHTAVFSSKKLDPNQETYSVKLRALSKDNRKEDFTEVIFQVKQNIFSKDKHFIDLPRNKNNGEVVYQLKSVFNDVIFTMIDNSSTSFTINETTGIITVQEEICEGDLHILKIQGKRQSSNRNEVTEVHILIVSAPYTRIFTKDLYKVDIDFSHDLRTPVFAVPLMQNIKDVSITLKAELRTTFQVEGNEIYLKRRINPRETNFLLHLTATLNSKHQHDNASIMFQVKNSDNNKIFSKCIFSVKVSRQILPPAVLLRIKSPEERRKIEMRIVSGNEKGYFRIDDHGNLLLEKAINETKNTKYILNVRATMLVVSPINTSSYLFEDAIVVVKAEGKSRPQFMSSNPLIVTIAPDAPLSKYAFSIKAMDEDEVLPGYPRYSIKALSNEVPYTIDAESGMAWPAIDIIEGKMAHTSFTVVASDSANLTDELDVHVYSLNYSHIIILRSSREIQDFYIGSSKIIKSVSKTVGCSLNLLGFDPLKENGKLAGTKLSLSSICHDKLMTFDEMREHLKTADLKNELGIFHLSPYLTKPEKESFQMKTYMQQNVGGYIAVIVSLILVCCLLAGIMFLLFGKGKLILQTPPPPAESRREPEGGMDVEITVDNYPSIISQPSELSWGAFSVPTDSEWCDDRCLLDISIPEVPPPSTDDLFNQVLKEAEARMAELPSLQEIKVDDTPVELTSAADESTDQIALQTISSSDEQQIDSTKEI